MDYFTKRNTAVLALAQVVCVVVGSLAGGAYCKWTTELGMPRIRRMEFAAEYGFLFLLVPLAWVVVALVMMNRSERDGTLGPLPYYSGFFVLAGLLLAVWIFVGQYWFAFLMQSWGLG